MVLWDQGIEILRESIFAYAQVCNGNLGAGILAVTFLVRLALLPLGIRLARAAAVQQRAMARIQPELDALRARHKNSPARLAEETKRVFAREGVAPVSTFGCIGGLAQVPIFLVLYSSVRQAVSAGGRFFWIGDLARPDRTVAVAATMFTVLATATGNPMSSQSRSVMLAVSAIVTIVALSNMASGIGLYWAMSSCFGAAQGWLVQRSLRGNA